MTDYTDIYADSSKEAASQEREAEWEIEVGEVESCAGHYEGEIRIYAVRGDGERHHIHSMYGVDNDTLIEKAARAAVIGVARLNAGLASAKPSIPEKIRDVIETIQGETK